jgi:hypothetical protein
VGRGENQNENFTLKVSKIYVAHKLRTKYLLNLPETFAQTSKGNFR